MDELALVLREVTPYAGLAGISVIVFYYLFREFIRKRIFPRLTKRQAYRLLALFLVLVFLLAVFGISAWVYHDLSKLRQEETGYVQQISLHTTGPVISIEQLHGGRIYTGAHYVTHTEETSFTLQIGGLVDDKMRFSLVSSGRGRFVVDRLFVRLHGYADCPLRNEFYTIQEFIAIPAYAIYLSPEFAEYDLIPLDSPGSLGSWKYVGDDFDEFLVRFEFRPYTLFVISVEVVARDLEKNEQILLSSDLYKLIRIIHGNTGGCLNLRQWYTPELLQQPKQGKYMADMDILTYQLLTCDLKRDMSFLERVGNYTVERALVELEAVVNERKENPIFLNNLEEVKNFLAGSPSE